MWLPTINLIMHLGWHTCWLSYFTLVWYVVRTGVHTVTWFNTKNSWMHRQPSFLTHGALLHALCVHERALLLKFRAENQRKFCSKLVWIPAKNWTSCLIPFRWWRGSKLGCLAGRSKNKVVQNWGESRATRCKKQWMDENFQKGKVYKLSCHFCLELPLGPQYIEKII